ncbi:hypothetical protein PQO03_13995 [Lentisphaera profundi]|uniref:NodB homology domain-containing protein n=1 Tax=Lentisphaera profundi TaxID=1658616 RepID=A0ABY7VYZ8_9BACT|nr:hypothetical protein [Lentisphaera profundi]WDE98947.1 hypothetical protein PQO03_13995 [Lentisphaera profundi]
MKTNNKMAFLAVNAILASCAITIAWAAPKKADIEPWAKSKTASADQLKAAINQQAPALDITTGAEIPLPRVMVAAFQTDSTRVITYKQPVSPLLASWEINVGAHTLSHQNLSHQGASNLKDFKSMELFSGLIDLFKNTPDVKFCGGQVKFCVKKYPVRYIPLITRGKVS